MYENPKFMGRDHKELVSGTELFAAALFQRPVNIWLTQPDAERRLDCSGIIQGYDDDYVQIGGVRYSRTWCKFYAGKRIRA